MKHLRVSLTFLAFAIAIGGVYATKLNSKSMLLSAYEKTGATSCSPIVVDDDCDTYGSTACVTGKVIFQNPCNRELFKP